MLSNIRSLLEYHEGRVASAYPDSLGYLTIGVGHLIDKKKGGRLPDHIIDLLLTYDIEKHQAELVKALPWVAALGPVRLAVLTDMAFNLGVPGLLAFKKMLQAVQENQWDRAADEMLNSEWARQVGKRALRLATMMRSGLWPVS